LHEKAAKVAAEGAMIINTPEAQEDYANGLRYTVAFSEAGQSNG